MPEQLLVWALTAVVGGLATVLWYLGRVTIAKLEAGIQATTHLDVTVNKAIADLKVSVAVDMGAIRERLARLEGQAGVGVK